MTIQIQNSKFKIQNAKCKRYVDRDNGVYGDAAFTVLWQALPVCILHFAF
jgi:hypothetical protein